MAEEISPLEDHGWWMERLRKDAKANRPEALLQRLERLGQDGVGNYGMPICAEAAAELRRLVAENELLASALGKLRSMFRDGRMELLRQRDQATAQRDELLEALKYHQEQTRPIERTRAAITKAEEQK
jgi:hypothetical protein